MHYSLGLVSLLAASVSALYTIPQELSAVATTNSCTMPAQYKVTNFSEYTDRLNGTDDLVTFQFADADTGINTNCERNNTSNAVSAGTTPRWPCDNTSVEFIYQTSGLTVIEAACPGTSTFEASGLTTFNMTCTQTNGGSFCSQKGTLTTQYSSLEPRPVS